MESLNIIRASLIAKNGAFKHKINSPWGNKGDIVKGELYYNKYPDLFEMLYVSDCGKLLSGEDTIYQIYKSEKGIEEIKLSEYLKYMGKKVIFISKEKAEQYLQQQNKFIDEIFSKPVTFKWSLQGEELCYPFNSDPWKIIKNI